MYMSASQSPSWAWAGAEAHDERVGTTGEGPDAERRAHRRPDAVGADDAVGEQLAFAVPNAVHDPVLLQQALDGTAEARRLAAELGQALGEQRQQAESGDAHDVRVGVVELAVVPLSDLAIADVAHAHPAHPRALVLDALEDADPLERRKSVGLQRDRGSARRKVRTALEDGRAQAALGQPAGQRKPGETRSDHGHVDPRLHTSGTGDGRS